MPIWIYGPFVCGKASTAREMVAVRPDMRVLEPEWIGYARKRGRPAADDGHPCL